MPRSPLSAHAAIFRVARCVIQDRPHGLALQATAAAFAIGLSPDRLHSGSGRRPTSKRSPREGPRWLALARGARQRRRRSAVSRVDRPLGTRQLRGQGCLALSILALPGLTLHSQVKSIAKAGRPAGGREEDTQWKSTPAPADDRKETTRRGPTSGPVRRARRRSVSIRSERDAVIVRGSAGDAKHPQSPRSKRVRPATPPTQGTHTATIESRLWSRYHPRALRPVLPTAADRPQVSP